MNKYGRMLREQWEFADPEFVASLEDPDGHFAQMGQMVQRQVEQMLPAIEGQDQPGERYLAKVGRLNAARAQAEEAVLSEFQPPSDAIPEEPEGWDEMSHDDQETWIRENTTGPVQEEMLYDLRMRRLELLAFASVEFDPANLEPED